MKFGMQLSYGPPFPLAKFQQGHEGQRPEGRKVKGQNTLICEIMGPSRDDVGLHEKPLRLVSVCKSNKGGGISDNE